MTYATSFPQPTRLDKRNRAQFERIVKTQSVRPTWTFSKFLAFAVALLIHVITLIVALLTLWLLFYALAAFFSRLPATGFGYLVLAFFPALLSFVLAPRLGRWPGGVLPRSNFPALYGLTDTIAHTLKTAPIDGIVVNDEFNASYGRVGLKQKVILTIGIPLWLTLDDQERVALLAHELSHGANGDFRHGLIVGSAYNSLALWTHIAFSTFRTNGKQSLIVIVSAPIALIGWIGLRVLRRLLFNESRRAEYYADLLAANVAGTDGVVGVLTTLQFSEDYKSAVPYWKRAGIATESLFPKFREHMARVLDTPIERAKLEREVRLRDSDAALTHPPLEYRVKFLEAHRIGDPQVKLSVISAARLTQEFQSLESVFLARLPQQSH